MRLIYKTVVIYSVLQTFLYLYTQADSDDFEVYDSGPHPVLSAHYDTNPNEELNSMSTDDKDQLLLHNKEETTDPNVQSTIESSNKTILEPQLTEFTEAVEESDSVNSSINVSDENVTTAIPDLVRQTSEKSIPINSYTSDSKIISMKPLTKPLEVQSIQPHSSSETSTSRSKGTAQVSTISDLKKDPIERMKNVENSTIMTEETTKADVEILQQDTTSVSPVLMNVTLEHVEPHSDSVENNSKPLASFPKSVPPVTQFEESSFKPVEDVSQLVKPTSIYDEHTSESSRFTTLQPKESNSPVDSTESSNNVEVSAKAISESLSLSKVEESSDYVNVTYEQKSIKSPTIEEVATPKINGSDVNEEPIKATSSEKEELGLGEIANQITNTDSVLISEDSNFSFTIDYTMIFYTLFCIICVSLFKITKWMFEPRLEVPRNLDKKPDVEPLRKELLEFKRRYNIKSNLQDEMYRLDAERVKLSQRIDLQKRLAPLKEALKDRDEIRAKIVNRNNHHLTLQRINSLLQRRSELSNRILFSRYEYLMMITNFVKLEYLLDLMRHIKFIQAKNSLQNSTLELKVELDFLNEEIDLFRKLSHQFKEEYNNLTSEISREKNEETQNEEAFSKLKNLCDELDLDNSIDNLKRKIADKEKETDTYYKDYINNYYWLISKMSQ